MVLLLLPVNFQNRWGTLVFSAATNNLGPITINVGTLRGSLANLNNTITNNGSLIPIIPTNVTLTGSIIGLVPSLKLEMDV